MLPAIDPDVRFVGTSFLRTLNAATLRELKGAVVIQDNDEPLVVIIPYATYLDWQRGHGQTVTATAVLAGLMETPSNLGTELRDMPPARIAKVSKKADDATSGSRVVETVDMVTANSGKQQNARMKKPDAYRARGIRPKGDKGR